jgi:hypothetical protein
MKKLPLEATANQATGLRASFGALILNSRSPLAFNLNMVAAPTVPPGEVDVSDLTT